MKLFEKLNKLSEKRIKYFLSTKNNNWYKWSITYLKELIKEIEEAKQELNTNNVYLEDELGDILWDYLCLLNSLKFENKITSIEKVLERAYKKFSQRIDENTWKDRWSWEKIKKKQKEILDKEIKNLNNN